jgi:hypothetical protein
MVVYLLDTNTEKMYMYIFDFFESVAGIQDNLVAKHFGEQVGE